MRMVPVGLVMAGLLVGCGPKADAPAPGADAPVAQPQLVTITATDFAFAAPDTITPGMTTFRLVNSGAQEHHVIMARLDSGKTLADVQAALAANPNGEPAWFRLHGVASSVVAGSETGSTVNLPEGRYVLLCFIPDTADGAPHMMKGMVREMIATGVPNTAPAPTATAEIRMKDFDFVLPAMTAGAHTFKVVNDGPAPHEIQLVKLADGATAESYAASLAPGYAGTPQGHSHGGGGAIAPGLEQWWTTTLEAGNYVVTCFVPDASGKPHLVLGMLKPFTVAPAS